MGCGNSKNKGPTVTKRKVMPGGSRAPGSKNTSDDLQMEEIENPSAKPHAQAYPGSALLSSWDRPTDNAAHARIIKTVQPTENKPSKRRGRPAARPDSIDNENAHYDSSDDEEETHKASVAKQGEPAVQNAPGMVQDRPNLLKLFRPQTPNALMDLD